MRQPPPQGFCLPAEAIVWRIFKMLADCKARTSKNVSVALACRSISLASVEGGLGVTQGESRPPLKRLKYPPNSLMYPYISGICDLSADSKRPCNSWRRYCDTVEPPCLCCVSDGRVPVRFGRLTRHISQQTQPVWRTDDQRFRDPSQCQDVWTRSSAVPQDLTIVLQTSENPPCN